MAISCIFESHHGRHRGSESSESQLENRSSLEESPIVAEAKSGDTQNRSEEENDGRLLKSRKPAIESRIDPKKIEAWYRRRPKI